MVTKTPITHGTYNSYTNRKCRCEACRNAASAYMKKYRKTEHGSASARYYAVLNAKRAQLAARWVRKNRPDIWQNIANKAENQVDKSKYIEL